MFLVIKKIGFYLLISRAGITHPFKLTIESLMVEEEYSK